MRKLTMVFAAMSVALALSAGATLANTRTLAVLITMSHRWSKRSIDWEVLAARGQRLGSAIEVATHQGTVWGFNFKLARGSIRTTWYFTERDRTVVLTAAPVTSGTGKYAGARGYATVEGLGPGGTSTHTLTGAVYIQVVFHL